MENETVDKYPLTESLIIVLTAHALKSGERKVSGRRYGREGCLARPLDGQELYQVLLKWITTKKEEDIPDHV